MKKITLTLIMICCIACQPNKKPVSTDNQWSPLWNGQDLSGWNSYLGTPYNLEMDSVGNKIKPFGIDNDPLEVVKIVKTDEGNAIRISGVVWGMIYTEQAFKNYHLKLKVKWGEDMHSPREHGPRDSGLLYHGFGNQEPILHTLGCVHRSYKYRKVIWAIIGLSERLRLMFRVYFLMKITIYSKKTPI